MEGSYEIKLFLVQLLMTSNSGSLVFSSGWLRNPALGRRKIKKKRLYLEFWQFFVLDELERSSTIKLNLHEVKPKLASNERFEIFSVLHLRKEKEKTTMHSCDDYLKF